MKNWIKLVIVCVLLLAVSVFVSACSMQKKTEQPAEEPAIEEVVEAPAENVPAEEPAAVESIG